MPHVVRNKWQILNEEKKPSQCFQLGHRVRFVIFKPNNGEKLEAQTAYMLHE